MVQAHVEVNVVLLRYVQGGGCMGGYKWLSYSMKQLHS